MNGDKAQFTPGDYLLASLNNAVMALDWHLLQLVGQKPTEPKWLRLPGMGDDDERLGQRAEAMTIEELHERLGWDPPPGA